jgi:MOSC domain-containing protein YiiM
MKILSLNVGLPREVEWHGGAVSTGIFKQPVAGRVTLRRLNLDGDRQADLTVHGGPYKAVYCYPVEHYEYWKKALPGRELPPAAFGENFTTEGILEDSAHLGDVFSIGTAEVAVTQPRLPCYKLGVRFQDDYMVKRFLKSGRSGFYLSVQKAGEVGAGDQIKIISRDPQQISIADFNRLYLERVLPCATLLIFLLLFLTHVRLISSFLYAKSLARKTPELWDVPKPLDLDRTIPTGGKIFCRLGYQFDSPWTDVISEQKRETAEVLIFSGGQGLVILDESKPFTAPGIEQQPTDKQSDQVTKALLGYVFRSEILHATPSDLHWFSSRQRMASASTFITLKSFDALHMQGGLYSFATPWLRGFQLGSPSKDRPTMVEMFDPQDFKFRLMFSSRNAGGSILQSDINEIISTLRPVTPGCN